MVLWRHSQRFALIVHAIKQIKFKVGCDMTRPILIMKPLSLDYQNMFFYEVKIGQVIFIQLLNIGVYPYQHVVKNR